MRGGRGSGRYWASQWIRRGGHRFRMTAAWCFAVRAARSGSGGAAPCQRRGACLAESPWKDFQGETACVNSSIEPPAATKRSVHAGVQNRPRAEKAGDRRERCEGGISPGSCMPSVWVGTVWIAQRRSRMTPPRENRDSPVHNTPHLPRLALHLRAQLLSQAPLPPFLCRSL